MIRNSRRMVALAVAGAVAIAPVITGCGAGVEAQSAAPTQLTEGANASVPKEGPAQILLRNMFLLGPKPGEAVSPGMSLALYGTMISQDKADRLISVSSPLFATGQISGGGIALPTPAPDGSGGVAKLLGDASPSPAPATPGQTGRPGAEQSPTGRPEAGATTPAPGGTATAPTASPTGGPTGENTEDPQTSPPATQGEGRPQVVLNGLNKALVAGAAVPVRLQFEKAGAVEVQVPLIPQQGEYNTYPLATPPGGRTPNGQAPGASGSPQPSAGTEPAQPGASPSPTGTASPPGTASPTGGQSPGAAGH
ncbi:hypothetical protein [Actinomadura sp. KC345]|uniref:hypothetical protein n=1 Tax=Actinomadura sp. KC345 TaxID=2530371 RepID=UPI001405533F|nr:hypothetical protein [Actinomadura sp. KC345]